MTDVGKGREPMRIAAGLVLEGLGEGGLTPERARLSFGPPLTLGAPESVRLGMDAALEAGGVYDVLATTGAEGVPEFPGYALLSGLAQNGLIRAGVESLTDEMLRGEILLRRADGASEGDAERLPKLREAMERLEVRRTLAEAASATGYFGGCLVYLDVGQDTGANDLRTPLPDDAVTRGALRRLTVVEPVNVCAGAFNASDPLRPDFFRPRTWWVMGREVHASRFLRVVADEPPLLLRPSYNFFGIGMAQTALDYVRHFTETREAAARLLTKFSLTALKTNMAEVMQGGGRESLDARVEFFARYRDNNGIMTLDRDTEDLIQLNTPLSGVDGIVRQSLELLAAVFRIPAVKLLGISPSGFNATGESDLRSFYDHVEGRRRKILGPPLDRLLRLMQLSEFGDVDPALTCAFSPLCGADEKADAETRKTRAEADAVYLEQGVLTAEEIRSRLAE